MKLPRLQSPVIFLLALVFTIGLTFASVELPYSIDRLLMETVATPDFDSRANPASIQRAELFIGHYHLRLIGYLCFGLTLLLIVVGFATRKSGFAAFGAVAFMLPVFAQFAGVMFFLAGLGAFNLLWLPVLDISYEIQKLGRIIRAPYDLVMWLLGQVGVSAYWPLVYCCIGGGLLLFLLGTFAWLSARARRITVADFWVYRFSRHPQYVGWTLWTYGFYILLMRGLYPKRSWGIDASLPWLLSTMVIIGVAMIEELNMRRRFGDVYEAYRRKTPFLFPVPAFLERSLAWPFRLFFGKERPERSREVAIVLGLYTLLLIGASALFYGGGMDNLLALASSERGERERIERAVRELKDAPTARQKYFAAGRLAEFGRPAVPRFIDLLKDENAAIRTEAADRLGELSSLPAVQPLIEALTDPTENVRHSAIRALGKIGAREAREPILSLAMDADRLTQRLAARALVELKEERAVDLLLVQLLDSVVWTRIGAAEDLGTLRSERGVPLLLQQLKHENPALRRVVVVALMQIGSPACLEGLREARSDGDWEVRLYAAEAVENLESSIRERLGR